MIKLFSRRRKAQQAPAPQAAAVPAAAAVAPAFDVDEEIFAVIAAAVAAMAGEGGTLVVRQIRRVGITAPAWSAAGRADIIHSRG